MVTVLLYMSACTGFRYEAVGDVYSCSVQPKHANMFLEEY